MGALLTLPSLLLHPQQVVSSKEKLLDWMRKTTCRANRGLLKQWQADCFGDHGLALVIENVDLSIRSNEGTKVSVDSQPKGTNRSLRAVDAKRSRRAAWGLWLTNSS